VENRSHLSLMLIGCGTILIVASLVLIGYLNALAAADVHDHRSQSASILRDSTIERVTLAEWERPTPFSAYATILGGFLLIVTGIRKAPSTASHSKTFARDEFA